MIESKHKMIDGVEYTCTQFPARAGIKLKITLGKKLLPGLSELLGGQANLSDMMGQEITAGKLASAVEKAIATIDPDEAVDLIMQILSQTRRGTREGQGGVEFSREMLDLEYAGKYLSLYKVIGFVLQTNYGDFLKGINTTNLVQ